VRLSATAVGQFAPGSVGGPNATQGFEGDSTINSLDFVLMIEGSLLFGGTPSRRYGTSRAAKAAFPFTVYSSAVGYGSRADRDAGVARGEMWMPLWQRWAGFAELAQLLAEGRAELAGRQATSGVELARAAASFGVDRGIASFVRYGFLPRSGRAYLATPLGRFSVRSQPALDLLRELDPWLDRYRPAASDDKGPPRFRAALRRIESAIFDLCQHGGPSRFAGLLCALGRAERELASGERFRESKRVRPLAGLSAGWVAAADDGSTDFSLALALSTIFDPEQRIGPMRSNLEPGTTGRDREKRVFARWAERDRAVVWTGADLASNLARVVERRLLDARRGGGALPLAFVEPAPLDAVALFLAGETDDARLADLLWGLCLVDHRRPRRECPRLPEAPPLPAAYALLKLLFLGRSIGDAEPKPDPAILPLLRARRSVEACRLALARLRIAGLVPLGTRRHLPPDPASWVATDIDPRRLAAALLFPVSSSDAGRLAGLAVRPSAGEREAVG